jgi:hypothetical protein
MVGHLLILGHRQTLPETGFQFHFMVNDMFYASFPDLLIFSDPSLNRCIGKNEILPGIGSKVISIPKIIYNKLICGLIIWIRRGK